MENQNLFETKEKMLNVFTKLNKITSIAKKIIIVLIVVSCISCFAAGIIAGMGAEKITDNEQIIQFFDEIAQKLENPTQETEMVDASMYLSAFAALFLMAFILDELGKIFYYTVENKTPFTKENVKCLKEICIGSVVGCVITSKFFDLSLIYAITMSAIYYMFKFAYILQQESDETL